MHKSHVYIELDNVFCDLVKIIDQIHVHVIYFLVNASPAKALGVATSNFAGAWVN